MTRKIPPLSPLGAALLAELQSLPPPPAYAGPRPETAIERAPWRCWRGSGRMPVRWRPLAKTDALRWFEQAERWPARQALPGRGRAALAVLRALLFRFLSWKTGRLDPSYEAIAHAAGYCRSAVAVALTQLRDLGILAWERRCRATTGQDGRFALEQESNAYVINAPAEWSGIEPAPGQPPLDRIDLGLAPPPAGGGHDMAVAAIKERAGMAAILEALESDPDDPLAATLARLGRAIHRPPDG